MPRITGPIVAAVMSVAIVMPAFAADEPERTRPPALEGTSLLWCGDVSPILAPADAYRDSPVYVANEQPMQRVRAWARTQPGYVDLWIDREHNGWLTLQFLQDAEARQADLVRLFPDVGVVAVPVEHTRRELRRLQDSALETLSPLVESFGVGVDTTANIVALDVAAVTDELVSTLEASFPGEPLCLDGMDPEDLPVPGPQPMAGDGWQLAGFREGDGPVYKTGVATDAQALGQLWAQAGLDGAPPETDLVDQVAIWFAIGHGSSCPDFRLDDVIVDLEAALVYPQLVNPDLQMMCTDDLTGSWQFIVLLDRDRLPPGPFTVQLGATPVARDRTIVEVDLSEPGVVAPPGAIHRAPHAGREPNRSGTYMETMGSIRYAMDVTCGIGYLGQVNDVDWVTDVEAIPDAWIEAIDGQELVVRLRLRARPEPRMTASVGGESVVYRPSPDGPPACDS